MASAKPGLAKLDTPFDLVASDLDGTILRPDLTVSTRVAAAICRVRDSGVPFIPVTARTPIGIRQLPPVIHGGGWVIFGNGALAQHLTSGEVLFEHTIAPDVLHLVAAHLRTAAPGVEIACVRARGQQFITSPGYPELAQFSDHGRIPETMQIADWLTVISEPASKFIARHRNIRPTELLTYLASMTGIEATSSGAPFVEVQAASVTKATGLAALCNHLGISPERVLAFGDAANDTSMLSWAKVGVAVANSVPETLAAADLVTSSITDDGVAVALDNFFPLTETRPHR